MSAAGPLQAVFNWEFISVMTSMSVIVVTVANTIGSILPRIGRLWAAFIASLLLTVYAAYKAEQPWTPGRVVETLVFAFILFCISAGANQTVRAVAKKLGAPRVAAQGGPEGVRPADARRATDSDGFWASWF